MQALSLFLFVKEGPNFIYLCVHTCIMHMQEPAEVSSGHWIDTQKDNGS